MDQQTFEQIEAYLQNRMSEAEKEAFEVRMRGDQELKAAVDLQLELMNAIETEAVKSSLDNIHQQNFGSSRERKLSRSWIRPVLIAASFALLILAGWLILRPASPSSDQLFATYYSTPNGLPTTLGLQDQLAFSDGMVDYKRGDFLEARQKWQPLYRQFSENDTLGYFLGLTYLENEQTDSALFYWQNTLEQTPSTSYNDALQWYMALALLKKGRMQAATERLNALTQNENPFRDRAFELINEIKDK